MSVLVKILGMGRTKLPKGAPRLSLGGQIVIFCWIKTIIDFDRHVIVLKLKNFPNFHILREIKNGTEI